MKGQIFACLSKNNFVNYELRRDFTVKVTKHWHSFSRHVMVSLFLEILKSCPWQSAVVTLHEQGIGPVDFQRCLPTSADLCKSDSVNPE